MNRDDAIEDHLAQVLNYLLKKRGDHGEYHLISYSSSGTGTVAKFASESGEGVSAINPMSRYPLTDPPNRNWWLATHSRV